MQSKKITCSIFAVFFIYLFLVYDVSFRGPDEPIYFAYTESLVEDGDLNAVNNIELSNAYYFPSGKMQVSKTYNLYDFHNHGGIVFWVPFYAYAKGIYLLSVKLNLKSLTAYGLEKLAKAALSFSTIAFGFLTLILTYLLARTFFSRRASLYSCLAIFFGTPFFYYAIFEPGNANIIASLFSTISILFLSYAFNMKRLHWLLYGIFFSVCVTIKADLWFQMFFILPFFVSLMVLKKTNYRKGVYFLIGFSLGIILKILNDYLKYGIFHEGHLGLFNAGGHYFFEQLFSSYRGIFYTSPIFYICLSGFAFLTLNLLRKVKKISEERMRDFLFFLLSSYLFMKIFIISYRYAWGGGSAGARTLLTEFPVFVLLFARALEGRKKYIARFIYIISIFFIFWNWLVVSEFISGLDLKYVVAHPKIISRIINLKYILPPMFSIRELVLKLKSGLLLFAIGMFFYLRQRPKYSYHGFLQPVNNLRKDRFFKILTIFVLYSYIVYAAFTVINVYNNRKNVKKLKEAGFFKDARVADPGDFEKTENIGSMNEMIEYFELKGDINKAKKIRQYKEEMSGGGIDG